MGTENLQAMLNGYATSLRDMDVALRAARGPAVWGVVLGEPALEIVGLPDVDFAVEVGEDVDVERHARIPQDAVDASVGVAHRVE